MEDESFDKLKTLAKAQGIGIGAYCEFMVDYIAKNGINPKESINALIQTNNKRLNQVIQWQTATENNALHKLSKSNEEIKDILLRVIELGLLKTS